MAPLNKFGKVFADFQLKRKKKNMEEKEKETKEETLNEQAQPDTAEKQQAEQATEAPESEPEAIDSQEPQSETNPVEEIKKEVEALKDKYLRSVAEFDNYRKRTVKEKAELILGGSEKAVKTILPVIDDMERAMQNGQQTDDAKTLREGMELIYHKLIKALESLGVSKIETDNADFDTDFHEAIAMVPGVDDEKKGKVIDCVQAGYKLNDKVIRHAKVAVGQ